MGYANSTQNGSGLRQRIYARSFIIGDPQNTADRFVYMVLDTQSGDTAIRNGILEGVQALGSDYAAYTQSNVAVTGTHSHSGPVSSPSTRFLLYTKLQLLGRVAELPFANYYQPWLRQAELPGHCQWCYPLHTACPREPCPGQSQLRNSRLRGCEHQQESLRIFGKSCRRKSQLYIRCG